MEPSNNPLKLQYISNLQRSYYFEGFLEFLSVVCNKLPELVGCSNHSLLSRVSLLIFVACLICLKFDTMIHDGVDLRCRKCLLCPEIYYYTICKLLFNYIWFPFYLGCEYWCAVIKYIRCLTLYSKSMAFSNCYLKFVECLFFFKKKKVFLAYY